MGFVQSLGMQRQAVVPGGGSFPGGRRGVGVDGAPPSKPPAMCHTSSAGAAASSRRTSDAFASPIPGARAAARDAGGAGAGRAALTLRACGAQRSTPVAPPPRGTVMGGRGRAPRLHSEVNNHRACRYLVCSPQGREFPDHTIAHQLWGGAPSTVKKAVSHFLRMPLRPKCPKNY